MALFIPDGAVELYHDNVKKFETTSEGVKVTTDIQVEGGSGDTELKLKRTNTAASNGNAFGSIKFLDENNNDISRISTIRSTAADDGDIRFETRPTGGSLTERLRILSTGNVQIPNDSGKLELGASQDLQIYHDGSHSYIRNNNGSLFIRDDTIHLKAFSTTDTYLSASNGGAVSLRYDNSTKFATTSSGINVTGQADVDSINCTGELDLTGHLDLNSDSSRIKLGAGDDFQLYHNGSNNYIETNNGDIFITTSSNNGDIVCSVSNTNGGFVAKTSSNETMINAVANASVELYENGSKKFETNSGGCTVTGTLTTTSGINAGNNISLNDGIELKFGNSDDLKIYHDGSHSYIQDIGTGNLNITSSSVNINNSANTENMVRCIQDGSVELYHNGSKRFETLAAGTHSSGQTHTFGASGSVVMLQAGGSNTDFRISAVGTGGWIALATGNSSAVTTDRWYVYGTSGHFAPTANNTYDIGTSTYRVRNIYTNDLHLSNEGSSNDVDSTWGDWTIQEGESDLFLKNNRSGKKYKFNLTEVS